MSGGFFNSPPSNKPQALDMSNYNSLHYWRNPAVEHPVHNYMEIFTPLSSNTWPGPPPPPPCSLKEKRQCYTKRPSAATTKTRVAPYVMVVRPQTAPPDLNEAEWDGLLTNVSNSLIESMREDRLKLKKMNDEKNTILHFTKDYLRQLRNPDPPLPINWTPSQSTKGKFPRKGDPAAKRAANEEAVVVETNNSTESGAITIVKNSRKIVRRLPGASIVNHGKIVKVQKQPSINQSQNMDEETDEAGVLRVGAAGSASDSGREGNVEITLKGEGCPSADERISPPISPARVVLFRGGEMVCETASKSPRSPFRTAQSPIRVRNVIKPSYATRGRGSMSLRVINGHRVTGDSRECYAYLNGNCQSGPFCRFEHKGSRSHADGKICSRLLRGLCRPNNSECRSPHSLLPHQYPICSFFLRTSCHESDCQLLHVRYTPQMRRCDDFVRGVCTKGDACDLPHTYPFDFIKHKGARDNLSSPRDAVPPPKSPPLLPWIE